MQDFSRRRFLERSALGVGSLAFAAMVAPAAPAAPKKLAKRIVWLYMDGGISHIDTFDPKPKLAELNGKAFPLKIEATQFDSNGPCLKSPWKTKQRGKSGLWISDLFPHLAEHADDLCVLRSMTNESAIHAAANYWMHTGWGTMGRPSYGSWIHYGLGSEADDLPGFVVLNGGMIPTGGIDNYKAGFLPAKHGPTLFDRNDPAVPNLKPAVPERQKARLSAIADWDKDFSAKLGQPDAIETGLRNYELAAKMQSAVPDLLDLSKETKETKAAYGLDHDYEHTRTYGRQCLLARKLLEKGVRSVAVTVPRVQADNRWDAHGGLRRLA